MFFHFIGIKDISEKNYTLDLLFQAPDITLVKDFLQEQKAITLGLENYEGDPESFGGVFFIIQYQNTQFKIFSQFEDIHQCIEHITPLELSIIEINYTKGTQLSPMEYQDLITTARQKYEEQKAQSAARQQKEQQAGIKHNDPRLKKAYEAIEEIINQIEQVQEIGGNKLDPLSRKKLEEMRGNISKLRLATNYDNIIEELHNAMNLIVKVQDLLLEKLDPSKIFPIFSGTQVSNIEVIREQTRLAKAQLLQALGAQLSREESMYASLSYTKLFSQYLEKDIKFALQNKFNIIQKFSRGLELISLFILLELTLLTVIAPLVDLNFSHENFAVAVLYLTPFIILMHIFNHKILPSTIQGYLGGRFVLVLIYLCIISLLRMLLIF